MNLLRLMLLFALCAAMPAASAQCHYGKTTIGFCKACSDLLNYSYSQQKIGNVCWGCSNLCDLKPKKLEAAASDGQPDPSQLSPETIEFLAQQTEPYCGPDPFAKDQDFFAIAINRDAFQRLAMQAPDAAMFLAAVRDALQVQPIRVRTGDGFAPSIPTARDALDAWDHPYAESGEQDSLLAENERFSTRTSIETLADGHLLLIVDSRVVDLEGATVAQPFETFAIELVPRAGVTRTVISMPDRHAQVYDVVSWGVRDTYAADPQP